MADQKTPGKDKNPKGKDEQFDKRVKNKSESSEKTSKDPARKHDERADDDFSDFISDDPKGGKKK